MKIQLPCPLCHGRRVAGDHGPSIPCPKCQSLGHLAKTPEELTHEERAKVMAHLIQHENPASAYIREGVCDYTTQMLTGFHISSVSFPEDQPREILIHNKHGFTLRIFPEFRAGAFHNLNVIPEPP